MGRVSLGKARRSDQASRLLSGNRQAGQGRSARSRSGKPGPDEAHEFRRGARFHQQQKHLATLHGRVVDARTGEPLAKVKVIASGADTTTDENGSFLLENLLTGQVELYITTVSFGLVKKT